MTIQEDLTFYDLQERVWGNAEQILDEVSAQEKEEEFMDYIEMVFADDMNPPSMTQLNDFISYDWEYIYQNIGMECNEDE